MLKNLKNLEILLKNCANIKNKKKLAIVSQNSLNYYSLYAQKIIELGTWSLFRLRNIVYKNSKGLGLTNDMLTKLEAKPTLNSGVYNSTIYSNGFICFSFKSINWFTLFSGYSTWINYGSCPNDYELLPGGQTRLCNGRSNSFKRASKKNSKL